MKRLILLLLLAMLSGAPLTAESRKYIVEFTAAPSTARVANAKRFRSEAAQVADVRREFTRAFNGVAVELLEGQSVDALKKLPNVAAIYPDSEVIAFSGPVTTRRAESTSVQPNAGGNGIVVAVIDTGVDGTHPALAGKVIGGYDFVNDDNDPMDDHRHGTHVAGIIAAQGEMTGVAPNVRLLAYKVLNAEGRGTSSDVIAAIERALLDGADVANLSLGDRGLPDDPMSRAVDNAVAAGMVVCVAAGNEETFHRIGSPAGAAKAITVGASTLEEGVPTLAYFSSRGPATQTSAIKPDVIAPGRDIYSTGLGHGYVTLSGTSMSTPYVSGLAALLLEEHPDWTPERVKAALVTTALPVAEEEVMSQGTGVATAARARTNTIVASPTQISFGLDGVTAPTWTSTRTIALRNDGNATRTIHANLAGATPAMNITVNPAELTLAPGQTAQIELTINVDHTTLGKPATRSLSFGGVLLLTTQGEDLRLPWAFVRASRVTITNDGGTPNILWRASVPRYDSAVPIGPQGMELLLEPGVFDFVVASKEAEELRLVIAEQQNVEGDVTIAVNAASAPHEIRFDAVDSTGSSFQAGDGTNTLRSLLLRLLLTNDQSAALPDITGRVMRTSTFSDRYGVLGLESFVDREAAEIHVAQFDEIRNVTASRVIAISPADYASQQVELIFPKNGARRDVGIMPRDWPRNSLVHRVAPPMLRFPVNAPSWTGTLFMTKEVHEDFQGGVQLALYSEGDVNAPATVMTPMIRRNDDGFLATWGFTGEALSVGSVAGETMSYGDSSIHLPGFLNANAQAIYGDAEIFGARHDRRRSDTITGKISVRDEGGIEVGSGSITPGFFFTPLPRAGKFTAEVKVGPFAMDDTVGMATMTTKFDTRNGPSSPPAITSFAILDGTGRHANRLRANGNGTLMFSAADHEQMEYHRVVDAQVFFRRVGANAWVQLTAVATGDEDLGDDYGRWAAGLVYRVDLRNALQLGAGQYEIAIEVRDAQGNTTSWQIAPAFIVETGPSLGRRRAVGK
ncbi:MAG TPA: S8 family serine peptidase [Thermoanaerobaculia bacterium]|jgi:subtilisin family serine protease|nr:S8 family serine peptidase [Thermoanaerobaculia bacterium]